MPTKAQIREQVLSDQAVTQMLAMSGDVVTLPHTIDQQFLADDERVLAELARVAPLLMLEAGVVTRVARADGTLTFDLMLRWPDSTTATSAVTRQSILMVALAEAFGATYNGWGTRISKGPVTSP